MPSPNYTVHHRIHALNLNLALGGLSLVLDEEWYNFLKKKKKRRKTSLGKILFKMGVFKSRIKFALLGFGEREQKDSIENGSFKSRIKSLLGFGERKKWTRFWVKWWGGGEGARERCADGR